MLRRRLRVARHYRNLFASSLVLVALACGGTTESPTTTGNGSGAAAGAGGAQSGGGHWSAGAAAGGAVGDAAGTFSSGGRAGAGTGGHDTFTAGTVGQGGTVIIVGGAFSGSGGVGGSVVDSRCPERVPNGLGCTSEDSNASCQYDPSSGCLCYLSAPGSFTPCQQVDPTCTFSSGGGGGAGGSASAGAAGTAGIGGISAKIALPPRQLCSCTVPSWTCTFGI